MSHHNSESTEPEALPVVCPHCLIRNSIGRNFCRRCGTPLTSLAVNDPLGKIYSEGDTYRKAIDNPSKPIVLVGMWLLWGPFAIAFICFGVCFCRLPFREPFQGLQDFALLFGIAIFGVAVFGGAGALILVRILYPVTRGFIRDRRRNHPR
jgi:hypothetical protein